MTTPTITKPQLEESAIRTAIQTATTRWRRNKQPDAFSTKVAVRNNRELEYVSVRIYHHETFPQGSQTFTMEVRELPDTTGEPGEFIHRERLHLAPHERCR